MTSSIWPLSQPNFIPFGEKFSMKEEKIYGFYFSEDMISPNEMFFPEPTESYKDDLTMFLQFLQQCVQIIVSPPPKKKKEKKKKTGRRNQEDGDEEDEDDEENEDREDEYFPKKKVSIYLEVLQKSPSESDKYMFDEKEIEYINRYPTKFYPDVSLKFCGYRLYIILHQKYLSLAYCISHLIESNAKDRFIASKTKSISQDSLKDFSYLRPSEQYKKIIDLTSFLKLCDIFCKGKQSYVGLANSIGIEYGKLSNHEIFDPSRIFSPINMFLNSLEHTYIRESQYNACNYFDSNERFKFSKPGNVIEIIPSNFIPDARLLAPHIQKTMLFSILLLAEQFEKLVQTKKDNYLKYIEKLKSSNSEKNKDTNNSLLENEIENFQYKDYTQDDQNNIPNNEDQDFEEIDFSKLLNSNNNINNNTITDDTTNIITNNIINNNDNNGSLNEMETTLDFLNILSSSLGMNRSNMNFKKKASLFHNPEDESPHITYIDEINLFVKGMKDLNFDSFESLTEHSRVEKLVKDLLKTKIGEWNKLVLNDARKELELFRTKMCRLYYNRCMGNNRGIISDEGGHIVDWIEKDLLNNPLPTTMLYDKDLGVLANYMVYVLTNHEKIFQTNTGHHRYFLIRASVMDAYSGDSVLHPNALCYGPYDTSKSYIYDMILKIFILLTIKTSTYTTAKSLMAMTRKDLSDQIQIFHEGNSAFLSGNVKNGSNNNETSESANIIKDILTSGRLSYERLAPNKDGKLETETFYKEISRVILIAVNHCKEQLAPSMLSRIIPLPTSGIQRLCATITEMKNNYAANKQNKSIEEKFIFKERFLQSMTYLTLKLIKTGIFKEPTTYVSQTVLRPLMSEMGKNFPIGTRLPDMAQRIVRILTIHDGLLKVFTLNDKEVILTSIDEIMERLREVDDILYDSLQIVLLALGPLTEAFVVYTDEISARLFEIWKTYWNSRKDTQNEYSRLRYEVGYNLKSMKETSLRPQNPEQISITSNLIDSYTSEVNRHNGNNVIGNNQLHLSQKKEDFNYFVLWEEDVSIDKKIFQMGETLTCDKPFVLHFGKEKFEIPYKDSVRLTVDQISETLKSLYETEIEDYPVVNVGTEIEKHEGGKTTFERRMDLVALQYDDSNIKESDIDPRSYRYPKGEDGKPKKQKFKLMHKKVIATTNSTKPSTLIFIHCSLFKPHSTHSQQQITDSSDCFLYNKYCKNKMFETLVSALKKHVYNKNMEPTKLITGISCDELICPHVSGTIITKKTQKSIQFKNTAHMENVSKTIVCDIIDNQEISGDSLLDSNENNEQFKQPLINKPIKEITVEELLEMRKQTSFLNPIRDDIDKISQMMRMQTMLILPTKENIERYSNNYYQKKAPKPKSPISYPNDVMKESLTQLYQSMLWNKINSFEGFDTDEVNIYIHIKSKLMQMDWNPNLQQDSIQQKFESLNLNQIVSDTYSQCSSVQFFGQKNITKNEIKIKVNNVMESIAKEYQIPSIHTRPKPNTNIGELISQIEKRNDIQTSKRSLSQLSNESYSPNKKQGTESMYESNNIQLNRQSNRPLSPTRKNSNLFDSLKQSLNENIDIDEVDEDQQSTIEVDQDNTTNILMNNLQHLIHQSKGLETANKFSPYNSQKSNNNNTTTKNSQDCCFRDDDEEEDDNNDN
jgi:cell division protein FtsL